MKKYLRTSPTWASLPIRIALGSVMFVHGAQKVMGVWGGRGFSTWIAGSAPFGFMRPSWLWLSLAAFSEFIGGMLVIIGLLTRPAAFLIACTMLTAVLGVHWGNGFLQSSGGFEYPGALLGMAISLLILGGGQASVDQRIG
ncbi:MAG: DoxX family protein [Acidobacteria bacterium]|nr:DoxX family protein [Acidobacteriota bacterium]